MKQILLHIRPFIQNRRIMLMLGVVVAALLTGLFTWWQSTPPPQFPVYTAVEIEEGMTVSEIVSHLKTEHIIRSETLLSFMLAVFHSDDYIQAGSYVFDQSYAVFAIADAITSGEYISPPLRITIPEGLHGEQIVAILEDKLSVEDAKSLKASQFDEYIGYLFPDTYFVPDDFTQEEFINLMRRTFEKKLAPLQDAITQSSYTREELITLASIVVREADTEEDMRMVAGILENRLAIGMPLQVDASFFFLLGKTSSELTQADLAIDSPYNTYTNEGLPPTPIANPGLRAIEAVLNLIESDYYYYLTAPDGTFYYARTFDEHVSNKRRYLP